MDLTYPDDAQDCLTHLGRLLSAIGANDESAAVDGGARGHSPSALSGCRPTSHLCHVAAFRLLGFYALPLPDLLARTGLSYLGDSTGATALGWPDARAPWQPGDALTVQMKDGQLVGRLSVAPFCVPWEKVCFLATAEEKIVLVELDGARSYPEGDEFRLGLDATAGRTVVTGQDALREWQRRAISEQLGLVGLTMGVIDRSWRIALEALCAGRKTGSHLADEQVAQFQLSDNYIERLATEQLAMDVGIDADKGREIEAKLALVRYATSAAAERCSQRAHHLAAIFMPDSVSIARWMSVRAHQLSVFTVAREHAVPRVAHSLPAGLRLE